MGGVTQLIQEAEDAGLSLQADGERLILRGPRKAEKVVKQLIARKADVLLYLWSGLDMDDWIRRQDFRGRWGWERRDLTKADRWWARGDFEPSEN